MRVIICSDAIGSLPSATAGAALAEGWPHARTEVVGMAPAGDQFAATLARLSGAEPAAGMTDGVLSSVVDTPQRLVVCLEHDDRQPFDIDRHASSVAFGRAVRTAIESSPHGAPEVVVDVSTNRSHDAGAGFLAGLGATADVDLTGGAAALAGIRRVELAAARELLAGRALTVVVPDGEDRLPLLGLRGITARHGTDSGWQPELMLATDAALQSFTVAVAPDHPDEPGWGACGGAGFAAMALGGRVLTGTDYCAQLSGLDERCQGADLLVTGCTHYDFARRGGSVVARATRAGAHTTVPVILFAADVFVGQREMRAMGIESAYSVQESLDDRSDSAPDPDEVIDTARRIGRTWTW